MLIDIIYTKSKTIKRNLLELDKSLHFLILGKRRDRTREIFLMGNMYTPSFLIILDYIRYSVVHVTRVTQGSAPAPFRFMVWGAFGLPQVI